MSNRIAGKMLLVAVACGAALLQYVVAANNPGGTTGKRENATSEQATGERIGQPIGIRTYIGEAKIQTVTPASLQPGNQFMVDVLLALHAPVSQAALMSSLRVFVDAVEVSRADIDSGEMTSVSKGANSIELGSEPMSAESAGGVLSSKVTLSLFALAPKDLSPYRSHIVSVYSQLDRRSIASIEVAGLPISIATTNTVNDQQGVFGAWAKSPAYVMVLPFLMAAIIGAAFVWMWRERRRVQIALAQNIKAHDVSTAALKLSREGQRSSDSAPIARRQAKPAGLPQRLFDEASAGSLSIVIGGGVSAQAGLPASDALYRAVLADCGSSLLQSQSPSDSLAKLLAEEGSNAMIEALVTLVGRDRVIESLQRLLLRPNLALSRLHHELGQLPIRACVDMTWDGLSLTALNIDAKDVYGPNRKVGFSTGYRSGTRQLIKPFGSVSDPGAVVLTEHEFRRQMSSLPELQRSIAALFSSQTLLFVGMSLKSIGEFLTSLPPEMEGGSYLHYALIPEDGNSELWQAGLGRRFGIEIIGFTPSEDFREVPDAIATLNASVRTGTPADIAELSQASAKLRYVQLKSIGLFRELRVELAPGWTLLLGNNGGGKSTILRAIALALCGNDARLSALSGRLLRSGESTGLIEIGVGSGRIVSSLVRDEKAVSVRSPQTTLLQSGQMLVLAFPALRGVVSTAPQGPTAGTALNPSVDDVLPLLQGMVDSRLNNLQQWLVNAVLRAEKKPKGRDAQMLTTFQSLISEMVPGGRIEYSRLDRTLWTVYFKIDDIEIPFDGISQGMSSILNWVGVLLQRLYDVYPNASVPEDEAALVLIDEIDAHLHPIWQRQLVSLSRKKFPKVQVVASSHSPLLAGAVAREELRIVERDPETGQIRAAMPIQDLAGQKVEDILTSSLFSLPTTRSPDAEQDINRYFELFEKPAASIKRTETVELKELEKRLQGLNYGPTFQQKKVNEEIKADIDLQLKTLSPDAITAMQGLLNAAPAQSTAADEEVSR